MTSPTATPRYSSSGDILAGVRDPWGSEHAELSECRVFSTNSQLAYAEAVALVGKEAFVYGVSVLAMHNLALVNPSKVHVATNARLRKCLPEWVEIVRPKATVKRDDFNGIRSQSVADAIVTCKNSLMRERLVSAVIDAKRKGLIDHNEAQELEKEFGL